MASIPVVYADLGDGQRRRLFLGADELRQIKKETGRGFFTLYTSFDRDAEPDEVTAILRLALIGGGENPPEALKVVSYYCTPPRPMKEAYMLAYECLHAAWAGTDESPKGGKRLTTGEMDRFFVEVEAALIKGGKDLSVLTGKSFAEIQELFAAMKVDDDAGAAPDADTFIALKKAAHKAKNKAPQ